MSEKSEYTKKALKDLQKISTTSKVVHDEAENDNFSDEDDKSNEIESGKATNLIIKNFLVDKTSKKRKLNETDSFQVLMAQHELDRQELTSLQCKLTRAESDLEKEELKSHYMKLEFGNTQIELEEHKEKVKNLDKSIAEMKTQKIWTYVYLCISILLNFLFLIS